MSLNKKTWLALGAVIVLSACGTTPAPEFNGKWRPVNRFAQETQAIPLHAAYTYYATPLDATLKGLLTRWSADTRTGLSYQVGSDYTLHAPVSHIRAGSPGDAVAELDRLYAAQGIEVGFDGRSFVVRTRPAQPEPASP